MPEGDSIHRLAQRMSPRLVGRRIDGADLRELPGAAGLVGAVVSGIEAYGKHLLMHVDSGLTLRSHLGMNGRWRDVAAGQSVDPRPRIDLRFGERRLVCVDPPQVELFRTSDLARNETLAALGPDLLRTPVDYDEVLRRARHPANAGVPLGEIIIDQRVAAGFGNVFKSEMCFLHHRTPWALGREVDDELLRAIFVNGTELLELSLKLGQRMFTGGARGARPRSRGERLWVYRRAGKPCFACGTKVRQQRQGLRARVTYWCPSCQS